MNYVAGDVRHQLAYVGRSVVTCGLVVGSGGNLSARVPGSDRFWVTAAGTWLDRLTEADFSQVRLNAKAGATRVAGPVPTTELALHAATYRVRPDVNAIIHLHPQVTVMLDALSASIRLVTTDHAYYLRAIASTPFAQPGGQRVARLAAAAAADGTNVVLLAHHGCSVLGPSVELAHKRALYLEEAAMLTYRALVAGALDRLPECPAAFLAAVARAEHAGAAPTV